MLQEIKNTFVTSLIILLAVAGCSDHASITKRYQAEKLLFEANRLMQNYTNSGMIRDAANRQTLLNAYSETYDFSTEALSTLDQVEPIPETWELRSVAFSAANRMGQLYFAESNYDSGIRVLSRLIAEVPLSNSASVTTYLNLGQALHAAGKIDSAVATYDNLMANVESPIDNRGTIVYPLFNLPLHIYQVFKAAGDPETAQTRFGQAESYYSTLLDDDKEQMISDACHTNLSMLYHSGEFFELAVEHLLAIRDSVGEPHMAAQIRAVDILSEELNDLNQAESKLSALLENRDKRDTLFYPVLLWRKANLEMKRKDFSEVRADLNRVKNDYDRFYDRNPAIQLLIAQSFEEEKNWTRAKLEYDLLTKKYPYSDETMAAYLHLADRAEKRNDQADSKKLLGEAEQLYQELMNKGKGTLLEARAALFMADLRSRQKDWDSSAELLVTIGRNFKGTQFAWEALSAAADIYENQLQDKARADSLRNAVILDRAQVRGETDFADQMIE
ncbi:MAG: tetratricopeptide repeat protein [bacterium]|nr:tetratricopeptide repeat protein [bacterium]